MILNFQGKLIDVEGQLLSISKAECEESLAEFVRQAWHVIEPGAEYIHGWHVDFICEHLEAISNGEILEDGTPYNRLLINVPPGFSKSLLTGVFWPAWEWGPCNMAHLRYVCASHSQDLAVRDGLRMRRLITSDWYQARWGDRVTLTGDQNQKTKFENTATGFRQAAAAGSITGARGDRVLCFPYNEIVHTESGPAKIGDLVRSRKNVRVWSSNPGTGLAELKSIVDWKENPGSPIVEVGLSDGSSFRCTPDHKIWTSRGWVPAGLLSSSDVIPRSSVADGPNGARSHAKLFGKSSLGFVRRVNVSDLPLSKFGPAGVLAPSVIVAFEQVARNLSPRFSASDLLYRVALHAKRFGKLIGNVFAIRNRGGLLFGQNCSRPVLVNGESTVRFGVSNVFGSRAVLKVGQSCVITSPILVSDFLSGFWRSNKSQKNGLMDEYLRRNAISVGVESWIPFARAALDNLLRDLTRSAPCSGDGPRLASNSAQIAYAVQALETDERFPVFVREVGHEDETFCLTVEGNHTFFVGNGKGVLVSNCDDPHSVEGANSDAMRRSTVDWFLEAVPTRLNNPKKSAIVVIMQRLHEEDVSGVILDKDLGYDHIMLPMRYDPTRHCVTKLGIEDPRTADGELLFPDRFPLEVVDRDERVMGPYAVAGQFQQQPTPRGGGVIKADWWQPWDADAYPPMDYVIASLDTAYTTKQENDYSALTVWGVFSSDTSVALANKVAGRDGVAEVERTYVEGAPRVMLMAAWQERIELSDLIEKVANTCRRMRVDKLLIESKAAGISVAQELRRLYGSEDWSVQLVNPGSIDKLARLYSVQHLFSEGLVYAPDRGWADTVIRQCEVFPKGKNDDLVDTASMALRHLRELGLLSRASERSAEIEDQLMHRGGPPAPLYPV